ncbi:MAG TPA: MOSC domain-containing protein, partial [Thermoanaerobaculia bacterium]
LELFGRELAEEVGRRHGTPVEMMHLNRGIFDEASVSLITSTTVAEAGRLAGRHTDVRRFRPNILIASARAVPFEEDEWVEGVLTFGEASDAVTITVTNRDERCAMVNYDPDSARSDAEVMKAIVRVRENRLGVYGSVTRRGRIAVGQPIFFERT